MQELKFEMKTDLVAIRNTELDANFDECKAALEEMMAPYKGMVVTEDNIPGAKADRARINAVYKSIDEARKSVKRMYNTPLKLFEEKCKELTDICIEASGNIDRQVKLFEAEKKTQKKAGLEKYFDENAAEIIGYLTFDAIFDPRWLNVTYDIAEAKTHISNAILKCERDIASIRALDSKYELALLDDYKRQHDLNRVLSLNSAWIEKDKEAETLKAQRERELEAARMAAEQAAKERQEKAAQPQNVPEPTTDFEEPTVTVDFRVVCTQRQLALLKTFLKQNGIKYGRCGS